MVRKRGVPSETPGEAGPVWDALSDLVMETMMFHRAWARRQGLTSLQFTVLKTLHAQGPLQPSQIADHFGISRSAVSGEINTLEAGGWILRTQPKGNRRTRLTSLTPRARTVLETAGQEYRAQLIRGLSGVPAGERAQLTRTITALVAQLRQSRDGDGDPPKRSP
jgi:MarR family transcriptional regulator, organic hydroperoxide resistance regulator